MTADFTPIVVLSGAGLSAASGVPTFRDAGGLWTKHDLNEVATIAAWRNNPRRVREFHDELRLAAARVTPNPGHYALATAQERLGSDLVLVTQNGDGLLTRAGCQDVIEVHGSIWKLRCERDVSHPWIPVVGRQDPEGRCACGGHLRPAVVFFGEEPMHFVQILEEVQRCRTFVSVGTSGEVHPVAGLVRVARLRQARCIEVNPVPSRGDAFDEVIQEPAEVALPRLVEVWAPKPTRRSPGAP